MQKTVHINFNTEDFDKIKTEAKKLGMPISTYIKMIVLKNIQS